jgi:DNA (cytosine-5)-methyltransferase 1
MSIAQSRSRCACSEDAKFLRSPRPLYEELPDPVRVVDLFAGCGGLTLGVAEAARRSGRGIDVRLALDSNGDAAGVFHANFPAAIVHTDLVEGWFDGELGSQLTKREDDVHKLVGRVDVLLGGPPCQGHSDLNNRTRRDDERNGLYARMARAAEVLRPEMVLVENVPTVKHDVERIVEVTIRALRAAGFGVDDRVIDLLKLGAPQRRRRHVILALKNRAVDPRRVLDMLGPRCEHHPARTVRWAIGDLLDVGGRDMIDTPAVASADNERRMRWLFRYDKYDLPNQLRPICHQSEHSYRSMYGRLQWDEPAQTVTTGFGSMGQGRYVHPGVPRTMTAHEAARLQGLPDFLDFRSARTRGAVARLVGNAVPPVLSMRVAEVALPLIRNGSAAPIKQNGRRARSVPGPSSDVVARRMRATRQRDTEAEQLLRHALDKRGLRYNVHLPPEPGLRSRADVVFTDARVAVYLDGCFWHACPEHGTWPKANSEWWRAKLETNRRRDVATTQALHRAGWQVFRFWAHESPDAAATLIADAVREPAPARVTR